jgi:hypothetical protein
MRGRALAAARDQHVPVPELEIVLNRIRGAPRYQLASRRIVGQAAKDLAAMHAFLEALTRYSPGIAGDWPAWCKQLKHTG